MPKYVVPGKVKVNPTILTPPTVSKSINKRLQTSSVVLTSIEKQQLKELNAIMSTALNMLLWNQLRRFAKRRYSMKLIGVLDASGLCSRIMKYNATHKSTPVITNLN
jgi:hypothetical protein